MQKTRVVKLYGVGDPSWNRTIAQALIAPDAAKRIEELGEENRRLKAMLEAKERRLSQHRKGVLDRLNAWEEARDFISPVGLLIAAFGAGALAMATIISFVVSL